MAYQHVLTSNEQRELIRIARATLREHLRSGRIPPGRPHRESLVQPAGVFVTLRLAGELRGCIGVAEERDPLYRAIQNNAVAAATRDPRFPPITDEDLDRLSIEISVLGEHRRVSAAHEIEIGRHGLQIEARGCRGLLLPQVAADAGWDGATFLEQLCTKAGLPRNAWTEADAIVHAFTAQVFGETGH